MAMCCTPMSIQTVAAASPALAPAAWPRMSGRRARGSCQTAAAPGWGCGRRRRCGRRRGRGTEPWLASGILQGAMGASTGSRARETGCKLWRQEGSSKRGTGRGGAAGGLEEVGGLCRPAPPKTTKQQAGRLPHLLRLPFTQAPTHLRTAPQRWYHKGCTTRGPASCRGRSGRPGAALLHASP